MTVSGAGALPTSVVSGSEVLSGSTSVALLSESDVSTAESDESTSEAGGSVPSSGSAKYVESGCGVMPAGKDPSLGTASELLPLTLSTCLLHSSPSLTLTR